MKPPSLPIAIGTSPGGRSKNLFPLGVIRNTYYAGTFIPRI
jgi:hypothetical protein